MTRSSLGVGFWSLSNNTDKEKKKKKKLTWGPNDVSGIVWAHFVIPSPPTLSFLCIL